MNALRSQHALSVAAITLFLSLFEPAIAAPAATACSNTATALLRACRLEAGGDLQLELAICTNLTDGLACRQAAQAQFGETMSDCNAVRSARADVCAAIGEARYQPAFGAEFASNFVDPDDIGSSVAPNPYLPLVVGNVWVYRKRFIDEDGEPSIETVRVTVTNRTRLIEGIHCRVVRDVVSSEGELIEDTEDWVAQDTQGNVWYCGENSKDYEFNDGDRPEVAELVSIDGTFKAGRDGAKAGILMQANPIAGMTYREEASWSNAEDLSQVLSVTGSESVPAASCSNDCLVLRAFSPVEPGVNEIKYYAPGVGQILTLKEGSTSRSELVQFIRP